jgi:ribosomal protein S18 acetylase RimI-like enzyme
VDDKGTVAGALLLFCRDGIGFVADVGTAPSYRRAGVATALVAAAASLAQGRGNSLVALTARRDDKPRQLYARLGFEVIGESVDWLRGP